MPIVDTEISNLNPIPSSWSELEVENFIKNRCKFPAADPDVDTYNCSYSELFKYANSAINQNSTSIAGALSVQQKMLGGVTSIWYVDADNGLDTNDGKSIAYSFKTLDKALSSVSACNLIFITSSTAITYSITSDVTLPNNTYIISNSPLVNISLSSVSFGTDSAIYIKGSLTIGNINLSSKLILSSRDLTLTSTHIGSNANIILAADTVTLGCTINGKVSVKSSSLYLVNNVILSDSYINVSFLYLGTSGYSYVTGSCHIRCDTVYNTPKENGSLIVTSGKLYVNINRVESSSTATWLMCTTILGNTASVVGFIGEEVDSSISYSGLGVADIRVTYAGEKYGSVIYDAVCNTQEDLQEALNDSSVHSVYLRYPLTALGTPTTYKYFYGETILWNISTANLIKFYNVCTLLDNVTFNTVYFSDVNASISKTVTASTLGYYERRSNIECINVSQKYWNTSVSDASYTEKGVLKINEDDFSIDSDSTLSLKDKYLNYRYVDGTTAQSSYFVGQGTISTDYGTSGITSSLGQITVSGSIDFISLNININSIQSVSDVLQWFETTLQIGYWSGSDFISLKTISREHTNDSTNIDDIFSVIIDATKYGTLTSSNIRTIGIKYTYPLTLTSSTYSCSLIQVGTFIGSSSSSSSDHLVFANSTDTVPNTLYDKFSFGSGIFAEVLDFGSQGKKIRLYGDTNVAVSIPVESFNFCSTANLGAIYSPPVVNNQPSDSVLIPMKLSPRCVVKTIIFRLGNYQIGAGERTCPFNIVFYASNSPYASINDESEVFGTYHSDNLNSSGYHVLNLVDNLITVPDKTYFWIVLNMSVQQSNDVTLQSTVAPGFNYGSPRLSTNCYGIINNYANSSLTISSPEQLYNLTINDGAAIKPLGYASDGSTVTSYTKSGTIIPYIGIELYK